MLGYIFVSYVVFRNIFTLLGYFINYILHIKYYNRVN